jgi:small GTP-binding protein
MINKKICVVGAFAVGKTSLIKQYVEGIFDEKYHTTIGVKIDKKIVKYSDKAFQLMLWDIEGVDTFTHLKSSYLRGASGILLVVDGTRSKTLEVANDILEIIKTHLGDLPVMTLINKSDLSKDWQFNRTDIQQLGIEPVNIFETSAKTNEKIEDVFDHLVQML